MIFKKTNIGNRNTYDVLIIDSIADTVYGNIALLKNNLEHDPQPFIIALGYDMESGTWRSGWYYTDIADAKNAFYLHTLGIEL